jgi:hypothetical protein
MLANRFLMTLLNLSFVVSLTSGTALALEDQATITGEFTWIVSDDLADRYPNGELSGVRKHIMKRIDIARNDFGIFEVTITLPGLLTAGQEVTATYQLVSTSDDGEMYFENKERSDDYLKCLSAPEWVQVTCHDITLKSVAKISADDRRAHALALYSGTPIAEGMEVIAGAEPGGTLEFYLPDSKNFTLFMGQWDLSSVEIDGQILQGTLRIDGITGTYLFAGATIPGLIENIAYNGDRVSFDWSLNGRYGVGRLQLEQGKFDGYWKLGPDFDQGGRWTGVRSAQ